MISTNNQQTLKEKLTPIAAEVVIPTQPTNENSISKVKSFMPAQMLLPNRMLTHHPKSGLNPIVDAASYLLSLLGKLKHLKNYRQLGKLQKDLLQGVAAFQENIQQLTYNPEYIVVCRYILCATFDDIIGNTVWGNQGHWDSYSLLEAIKQDKHHHDKFFNILDRALKEPARYIDLMELIYICLSMGYRGQYRGSEHSHYQLEQITDNLYKHIRAYRGSISKTLSPAPFKTKISVKTKPQEKFSLLMVFFVTACVVMAIFISLGYLMDVISNEAYKNIIPVEYQQVEAQNLPVRH